jgi:hypothetical protein
MTALLALGKLCETPAFPRDDVTAELLQTIPIAFEYHNFGYRELVPLLAQQGRKDLVAVLEEKLAEYDRHQHWMREEDWKGAVKRLDRRLLGARLYGLYASVRQRYYTHANHGPDQSVAATEDLPQDPTGLR